MVARRGSSRGVSPLAVMPLWAGMVRSPSAKGGLGGGLGGKGVFSSFGLTRPPEDKKNNKK